MTAMQVDKSSNNLSPYCHHINFDQIVAWVWFLQYSLYWITKKIKLENSNFYMTSQSHTQTQTQMLGIPEKFLVTFLGTLIDIQMHRPAYNLAFIKQFYSNYVPRHTSKTNKTLLQHSQLSIHQYLLSNKGSRHHTDQPASNTSVHLLNNQSKMLTNFITRGHLIFPMNVLMW